MPLYSLYIINKAGGLIYQTDFVNGDGIDGSGPQRLSSNEYLVIAGTFHGIHAITQNLIPAPSSVEPSGMQLLVTDSFKLLCHQTLTGIKLILTADVLYNGLESVAAKVYEIYADYALKSPFYQTEMPIRCELFDRAIQKMTRQ
ncbi:hypothetical protein MP638_001631 [Amoeboaphelidium occidentale]|nr:hypothetical protein MP638_001631 [Amoeboaphelidium occidentale]